jgi:ubiquinone/menaquinone biosynthesis C-methylase UbiE
MFTNPAKNLKSFGLHENDIVADLGAGTGFYSVSAGHIVNKGKVYAIEIVKDYLEIITNKVKEEHLHNVEIIWGNVEKMGGTQIADRVVDKVIVSNIFSQIEDRATFISEIKRILKKDGKVLFIDWNVGSHFNSSQNILSKDKIKEMFISSGFVHERDIDAGEHHYGIIFMNS